MNIDLSSQNLNIGEFFYIEMEHMHGDYHLPESTRRFVMALLGERSEESIQHIKHVPRYRTHTLESRIM